MELSTEATAAVALLRAQAERILRESGDRARVSGFDVDAWLTRWLQSHVPALGGRPMDYLGSADGVALVSRLLSVNGRLIFPRVIV